MQTSRLVKGILLPGWICLLLASAPTELVAQEPAGSFIPNRASQYYLGGKDELLIKVNIWGFVKQPGQYLVPRYTDLVSLISFAGGPREGANLSRVRIIRQSATNGVNGHNGRYPILSVNVKDYLEKGRKDVVPNLEAGDTVLIPQSFGNKFRNFLGVTSVVGLLAASATLYLALSR